MLEPTGDLTQTSDFCVLVYTNKYSGLQQGYMKALSTKGTIQPIIKTKHWIYITKATRLYAITLLSILRTRPFDSVTCSIMKRQVHSPCA
jgi:hypothetical protein